MKLIKWYKDKFKKHDHNRELFVTKGGYAFVKCLDCGAESMPWMVSKAQATQFELDHPEIWEKLKGLDNRKIEALCRNNL